MLKCMRHTESCSMEKKEHTKNQLLRRDNDLYNTNKKSKSTSIEET